MLAISIQFLAGRFHATPWGRHVNEGVPEWPPSPWRLMRGLASSWFRTCSDIPEDKVADLFGILATNPPAFFLPPASMGHTRHYMPWFKKGPGDTTLVFDTFVVVSKESKTYVIWPNVDLSPDQTERLARLLKGMTYIGRAESWCCMRMEHSEVPDPNCQVAAKTDLTDFEPVRTLVPKSGDPRGVLEALLVETGTMRSSHRQIDPPGSEMVVYARATDALAPAPVRLQPGGRRPKKPVAVRYALDRVPLPKIHDSLTLGERARAHLVGMYRRRFGDPVSWVLSGRIDGQMVRGHRHAFYLPTDEDGDGRIDHLTIFSQDGFDERDRIVLASLNRIRWGDQEGQRAQRLSQDQDQEAEASDVRLLLLGFLTEEELGTCRQIFGPATVWRSRTPMVLTRHPKRTRDRRPKLNAEGRMIDGPEDQVFREWALRRNECGELPELKRVTQLSRLEFPDGRKIRWLSFRRRRQLGPSPTTEIACGFELEFAEPVLGYPIAMGYSAHYGLGHFVPVNAAGPQAKTAVSS